MITDGNQVRLGHYAGEAEWKILELNRKNIKP